MAQKKLTLNTQDKKLAGVCAGLADYLEIDVTIIRVAFIFFTLGMGGGLLLYLIMWAVMPKDTPRIEGGHYQQ